MDSDDILDTSKLHFGGCFDEQVHKILQRIRLTRHEVEGLRHLTADLEQALQNLALGCKVLAFGSIVTGLGIRTSDIDCFVELPQGMEPTTQCVIQAKKILMRDRATFAKLFAITAAKVPILKFHHIPTQCDCDVSFRSPAGVQNSELLGFLLQMDHRSLHLTILIKYWSKVYNFTGTNLMPNYALSLLVVFYLQVKKILPPVNMLQFNLSEANSVIIENWETSFNANICFGTNNNESLYELLGGFFNYYINFNFNADIICPFLGHAVNKKLFERLDSVPKDFVYYKHNVLNKVCKPMRLDTLMCVQDPFDHSRNCTIAIYPRLMERVMSHFRFAAQMFNETSRDQFLRALLVDDPTPMHEASVDNTRNNKKHVFHNKIRKHIPKRNHFSNRQNTHHFANKHNQLKHGLKNMYMEMNKRRR